MVSIKSHLLTLSTLLWLAMTGIGWAQPAPPLETTRPQTGGAGGIGPPQQLPLISGSQDAATRVHVGPSGKPCLTIYGYAKQQALNPTLYDHVISASSTCAQPIKLRVCYYHSEDCVLMAVPEYAHQETILGVMPRMREFRFEYREQFEGTVFGFGAGGAAGVE
jgi:hypothetical protein